MEVLFTSDPALYSLPESSKDFLRNFFADQNQRFEQLQATSNKNEVEYGNAEDCIALFDHNLF